MVIDQPPSLRAKLQFPNRTLLLVMPIAAGIVVNIAEDRRAPLLKAIGFGDRVAEAVPEFQHSRNAPLIAFLSFEEGKITHLASARRGMRAATRLSRLNLEEVTELRPPIAVADIVPAVPNRIRRHAEERLTYGGLFPPATFVAVVDAIRGLSDASRPLLDRFSAARRRNIAGLGRRVRDALAYQKETVATALALAGIDRTELQMWQPPEPGPAAAATSFLDGLESARVREDPMVVNDMMNVPGFEQVRNMSYGAAVFQNDAARLTVVLANRLPLEQQLGADLIYFNETYKAFIIVQYKAMEKDAQGKAVFRLPNRQLANEIARMDVVLTELRRCAPNTDRHGFRLMENPFFLKLCPRIVFNPDDKGLTPGMYLPLDYWRLIEVDNALKGPKGGRQVTYRNVSRYLDNSGFINLVANAWIGTTISQTAVLEAVIREIIASGRTAAIAVKTETAIATSEADDTEEYDDLDTAGLFADDPI